MSMRTLGDVRGEGPLERHLAAMTTVSGGPHIAVGEMLTEQQYGKFRGCQRVLSNFLELAPAYAMKDQHEAFKSVMATTEQDLARLTISPAQAGRKIGTATDNVLSTMRGFIDKTPRLIARSWSGAESVVTAFNKSLSTAFDASADYRFGYHLRNYSQHAGLFPDVRHHERLNEDGKTGTTFDATLNADFLLRDYKKWHATVRRDLEQLEDRTIQLTELVERLNRTVEVLWAANLLALQEPLVKAAEQLRELDERAPRGRGSGRSTHVVSYHAPLTEVAMHDEYIRMDLVRALPTKWAECARLLGDEVA